MAKKYCICGFANDYVNGIAPKVCKACNKPFSSAFFVAPEPVAKPAIQKKKKIVAVEIEDEEIEEEKEVYDGEIVIPDRSSIEVTIAKRVSIAGLAQGQIPQGLDHNLGPATR